MCVCLLMMKDWTHFFSSEVNQRSVSYTNKLVQGEDGGPKNIILYPSNNWEMWECRCLFVFDKFVVFSFGINRLPKQIGVNLWWQVKAEQHLLRPCRLILRLQDGQVGLHGYRWWMITVVMVTATLGHVFRLPKKPSEMIKVSHTVELQHWL